MAQSNVETLRAMYEALGKGDMESVRAALAENCHWNLGGDNLVSGHYSGKEDIMDLFASLKELTRGTYWVELDEISGEGDTLTAQTKVSGERDGSYGEYVTQGSWMFIDGKMHSFSESYPDEASVDNFWRSF